MLRRLAAGNTLRIVATFEKKSSIAGAEDATSLKTPDLSEIVLERLIGAPPNMPADIKNALVTSLSKAMTDPKVVDWAKQTDIALQPETPDSAARILADQQKFFDKWKSVLTAG